MKGFYQEAIQANGTVRHNYKKIRPQVSIRCLTS